MKVVFEYDFDCVVPGILIKTLDGLFLYGTNSFLASEGRENISVSAAMFGSLNLAFRLI
jgi:lipopolysaccharide transport system ATP-binding protein